MVQKAKGTKAVPTPRDAGYSLWSITDGGGAGGVEWGLGEVKRGQQFWWG